MVAAPLCCIRHIPACPTATHILTPPALTVEVSTLVAVAFLYLSPGSALVDARIAAIAVLATLAPNVILSSWWCSCLGYWSFDLVEWLTIDLSPLDAPVGLSDLFKIPEWQEVLVEHNLSRPDESLGL